MTLGKSARVVCGNTTIGTHSLGRVRFGALGDACEPGHETIRLVSKICECVYTSIYRFVVLIMNWPMCSWLCRCFVF